MVRIFIAALLGVGVASSGTAVAAERSIIVLIHGAFETSEVWRPVENKLRQDGYKTIAVELPGRGTNPLPPGKATLDLYRDAVLAKIQGLKRPVVLVGHSFGGMTVAVVAEAAPEKIKTAVFVAAYLPRNGDSLLSLSQTDADSKMGPSFRVSDDKTYAFVDPAARGGLFCNDCSPELQAEVAAGIVNEPLAPPATPVALTGTRFGKVDKVYVHTANDVVVSPMLQSAMVRAMPVRKEITLQTGHAPFAKDPVGLAKAIESAAQ